MVQVPPTRKSRASNACEHCRVKKSKCDEGKPNCSNCKSKGIICTYGDVKPTKLEKTLTYILSRIEGLDSKIDSIIGNGDVGGTRNSYSNSTSSSITDQINLIHSEQKLDLIKPEPFESKEPTLNSNDIPLDITSFFGFNDLNELDNSPYIVSDSNQYHFFVDNWIQELSPTSLPHTETIEDDHAQDGFLEKEEKYSLRSKLHDRPDLFISTDDLDIGDEPAIIKSYLEHAYINVPIICYDRLQLLIDHRKANGIDSSYSAALYLLVLALGNLTYDTETHYWKNRRFQNPSEPISEKDLPPGFRLFAHAAELRSKLKVFQKPDCDYITATLLISVYHLKTGNLISFWEELQTSSQELYDFLSRQIKTNYEGIDPLLVDFYKRLLWFSVDLERNFIKVVNDPSLRRSDLNQLQKLTDIPATCKPIEQSKDLCNNFVNERNFLSFCFLANSLLTNLDEKSTYIILEANSKPLKSLFKIAEGLKQELQGWKSQLPSEVQWEEHSICTSRSSDLKILKMNYYKILMTIDYLLLKRINNETSILPEFIPKLDSLSFSIMKTVRSILQIISQLEFLDQTPFTCNVILETISIVSYGANNNRVSLRFAPQDIEYLNAAIKVVYPFTLHSYSIHKKYLQVKEQLKQYI